MFVVSTVAALHIQDMQVAVKTGYCRNNGLATYKYLNEYMHKLSQRAEGKDQSEAVAEKICTSGDRVLHASIWNRVDLRSALWAQMCVTCRRESSIASVSRRYHFPGPCCWENSHNYTPIMMALRRRAQYSIHASQCSYTPTPVSWYMQLRKLQHHSIKDTSALCCHTTVGCVSQFGNACWTGKDAAIQHESSTSGIFHSFPYFHPAAIDPTPRFKVGPECQLLPAPDSLGAKGFCASTV